MTALHTSLNVKIYSVVRKEYRIVTLRLAPCISFCNHLSRFFIKISLRHALGVPISYRLHVAALHDHEWSLSNRHPCWSILGFWKISLTAENFNIKVDPIKLINQPF